MNNVQRTHLVMSQGVSTQLETITANNALPALTAAHTQLDGHIETIKSLMAAQDVPVTGTTRARDGLVRSATRATLVVARLVLGYAETHGLAELEAKVTLGLTQLNRTRLIDRPTVMQRVHDAAASVVTQLADYGLTAAMLTDLQAQIDAAVAQLNSPRASIITRKVATEKLDAEFGQLDALLRLRLDPLMETLRTTDPDGYRLYKAARILIDRPGTPSAPETAAAPAAQPSAPVQKAA